MADLREKVPTSMRATYDAIVNLTDHFCAENLNEEYAALCRDIVSVMARKRPSPLCAGKPQTWAAGVVHALGLVNFLFDPAEQPHILASAIYQGFGVSPSSGSTKSKTIRDALRLVPFDPRWTLPSLVARNPAAWMIQVNGFMLDARELPREIQTAAYRKGLIPYVFIDGPPASGLTGSRPDSEKA